MEMGMDERDDERAADIAQEEEEDENGEQPADDGGVLDVRDGLLDEDGLVVGEAELEVGVKAFHQGDLGKDVLRGGDGVSRALLEDDQADRGLAVEARVEARFGVRVRDGGDVL